MRVLVTGGCGFNEGVSSLQKSGKENVNLFK